MKIKILRFLIIFTLLSLSSIYSQGFNGIGSTDGIKVLAAGDQGKIFFSSNGGITFSGYILNNTINYNSVFASDSAFWLSGSDGNLYKTSKNSVYLIQQNLTGASLNSVFFVNSKLGYACGDSGKVFKTSTFGASWSSVNSGIPNVKLNSISFLDSVNGALAGNDGRIYITSNGGTSWNVQATGTTNNLLKIKYYNGGIISVGEYGTLLKKNNGGNWEKINTYIDSDIKGISGASYNKIHICGGGGFIRNNSDSSSLFFNFEKNPMFGDLKDIVFIDSLNGFAVSSLNQAIIKTTNGGQVWDFTAGTTVSYSWVTKLTSTGGIGNNLCRHPNDRNSMFVMFNNLVFVSRNRGENWSQISSTSLGSSAHSFYVNPLDTNIWLCALGSPGIIARTIDHGQNWTTVLSMPFSNYGTPLEQDQNNPSVYYFAPDGGGFYKSVDTGKTFTEISSNYPFRSPCDILVMWENSNIIFIADGVTGSGVGQIFKSTNGGINWKLVHTNSSSSEIPALSNTIFEKSTIYATNWPGGNIYVTKNYGDNWSLLRTNSASGWAADICREDPTVILTGSYGGSSWLSSDAGLNFITIPISSGAGAGEIAVDRGYILDMRTQGVCKLNVNYNIITPVNENLITGIPDKFNLYQNYPNPFNPTTTIKFDIPKSGFVTLKLYDMLGREVNTVINGFRNSGTYEVNFNGADISSGVYFYRMHYDNMTLTKKLMLLK